MQEIRAICAKLGSNHEYYGIFPLGLLGDSFVIRWYQELSDNKKKSFRDKYVALFQTYLRHQYVINGDLNFSSVHQEPCIDEKSWFRGCAVLPPETTMKLYRINAFWDYEENEDVIPSDEDLEDIEPLFPAFTTLDDCDIAHNIISLLPLETRIAFYSAAYIIEIKNNKINPGDYSGLLGFSVFSENYLLFLPIFEAIAEKADIDSLLQHIKTKARL